MRNDRFDFEDLAVFQRALDLLELTDGFVRQDMANASASETAGAVCAADRLGIGPGEARQRLRLLLLEIIAMLTAMARNLRRRSA